jgi:hypothetical protein
MKAALLVLTSLLAAPVVLALDPPSPVPDSGSSAGLVLVALAAALLVSRKLRK